MRAWVASGIEEELDLRQRRLIRHIYNKIEFYYRSLYGTRRCYQHPLSLHRLKILSERSHASVLSALKYLAHTIPKGSGEEPLVFYDRISSQRNPTHRPYRIFLRDRSPERLDAEQ